MSLSAALWAAQSSLSVTSERLALVSKNIAGANNPDYSTKEARIGTNLVGASDILSISNSVDQAVFRSFLDANSSAQATKLYASAIDQLDLTGGDPTNPSSLSGLFNGLKTSLTQFSASPQDPIAAQTVLTQAQNLVQSLHEAARNVLTQRQQADLSIQSSVKDINNLLQQFQPLNEEIIKGTALNTDVTDAIDQRNAIVKQLSNYIGVTTVTSGSNDMALYTEGGATLFQGIPRQVTFQPTLAYAPTSVGQNVIVDGVPITDTSSSLASHTGSIMGLIQFRDQAAVTYQAQLDEMARGLVTAFKESDSSATPTLPDLPGLFTIQGSASVPLTPTTGLALNIQVNPNADPNQGGDLFRIRDGGLSQPSNPAYIYNTSGASGFSTWIQHLEDNLSSLQNFDSSTSIGGQHSLLDFSTSSAAWLQETRKNATTQSDYQQTLAQYAQTALSDKTGVNLDKEMTDMSKLQQLYQSTATVVKVINAAFDSLLSVVNGP